MTNNYPTLDELLQMKSQIENSQRDAMIQNQNMNTVANMTQNVSPMGNLGIALGTIGGNLAARYFNNQWEKDLKNTIEQNKAIQETLPKINALNQRLGLWHGSNLTAKGVYGDTLPFIYPDAQIKLSPLAQSVLQSDAADSRAWSERYANPTPPNPSLLATENNTATPPTNTAPSTSLFMKDNPSYDWRNQRYLSNNQPYFKPTYPNGMPKNYLTAYSAFR